MVLKTGTDGVQLGTPIKKHSLRVLFYWRGFSGRCTFFKVAMWYVYICKKNDKLYTGITTDLENRLRQHRNPVLLHSEEYQAKREAAKREKQIKGWSKEKKLNLANLKK